MVVYIFRHGETEYKQGPVTLTEANDLTPTGVRIVTESATNLAKVVGSGPDIALFSSPFGRCLHTAKVIKDKLEQTGILTSNITPERLLGEVENFEWRLFCPLVFGGEVNFAGERFNINRELTNPEGVSSVEFFRRDLAHTLKGKARDSLPSAYLDKIAQFERYSEVAKRLELILEKLRESYATTILVTHEGLTGEYVTQLAQDRNAFLGRGKYIAVRYTGRGWNAYTPQKGAIEIEKAL